MQIRLTYAQAQQFIIDVARQMITPDEDVILTLPNEWTTTPPTGIDDDTGLPPGAVLLVEPIGSDEDD